MKKKKQKSLIDKIIVSVKQVLKENNKKLISQVETMFGRPMRQAFKTNGKKVVVVEKHS